MFSPEQVMLDIDMGTGMYRFFQGSGGEEELDEVVDIVREAGIGGTYMTLDHTAENLREQLAFFNCFPRTKSTNVDHIWKNDPVEKAHELWKKIVSETSRYELEEEKGREIDKIVAKAEQHLE
jgi:trimethylamine:corrinoid methyltransferase-like protein